jgi:hypothetical protein
MRRVEELRSILNITFYGRHLFSINIEFFKIKTKKLKA